MSAVLTAIDERAALYPEILAVCDEHVSLTYAALRAEVTKLADVLQSMELRARPMAFSSDNSAAWVVLDLAAMAADITTIPLPPFFTEEQRRNAIASAGAGLLVTEDREGASTIGMTVCGRRLSYARERGEAVALPTGTAKITFTSGSTGRPKGVCLPVEAQDEIAQSLVDVIGPEFAGTHVAALPLAVLLENVAGLYPTLLAGGTYHAMSPAHTGFEKPFSPDFNLFLNVLRERKATSTILVPELLRGLLAAMSTTGTALPDMKLVAVGGARVPGILLDQAASLGLPVFQGYGLSETASVIALNTPHRNRAGSVGRLLPHVEAHLAPDGEVLITHPAFLGYAGGEKAPSIYHTGDIGRFDADGFLYFEGRKSNLIVTAHGRNVAPEWVEVELLGERAIGQAMVFGADRNALGALVVPSSMLVTEVEIENAIASANARLPEYAWVKHWTKVMPFTPMNGQLTENGRIRRKQIEAAYRELMDACFLQEGRYMTFFERLIAETAQEQQYLLASPQIQDGLKGQISLEAYLQYLGEAYNHVRHTVPLMKLARENLSDDKAWLKAALDEYIAEETGHEEWILDDIENAGGSRDAVKNGKPRLETELMVAYAYDFIRRVNPVGFFGMVFVLEGTSTQLATNGANALMKSLGLGKDSFRYLLSHGSLDMEHIRFLQNLLDRIDDPEDQVAVIHMAKSMFVLFANVFRAVPYNAVQTRVA